MVVGFLLRAAAARARPRAASRAQPPRPPTIAEAPRGVVGTSVEHPFARGYPGRSYTQRLRGQKGMHDW